MCIRDSPGGVLESARPGALLVDMSSINPMVSISLEQKLAEKGLRMLDAPDVYKRQPMVPKVVIQKSKLK